MNRRIRAWLFPAFALLFLQCVTVCGRAEEPSKKAQNELSETEAAQGATAPESTPKPQAEETAKKTPDPMPFSARKLEGATPDGLLSLFFYMGVLIALGFAAVYLIKNGWAIGVLKGLPQRKLRIADTRPLGNRQFLVVVEYESTKLLVGVSPGRIDYLHDLSVREVPKEDFATILDNPSSVKPSP